MNTFAKLLDEYIKKCDCSAAILAKESGISPSGLSRYRSGGRTPDREIILKIAEVLSHHGAGLSDEIQSSLTSVTIDKIPRYPQLGSRLSELINRYSINVNKLARYMGFDASFISRIRKGDRYPSKDEIFIKSVSEYLLDNPPSDFDMSFEDIVSYLKLDNSPDDILIKGFIDDIKIKSEPITSYVFSGKSPIRGNSKYYSDTDGIKTAISDFTNSLSVARTKNDIYIFSNISCDLKNIVRVAVSKEVTTHVLFDTGLSLTNTITALQEWIPFLKTDYVKAYYIPNQNNGIFNQVLVSSGVFSLFGECVFGAADKGNYMISGVKDDVLKIRRYAKQIFTKAKPLLSIQDSENFEIFHPGLAHLFESYKDREE